MIKKLKSLPQWLRITVISATGVALLAVIVCGVLFGIRSSGASVNVYSADDVEVDYFGIGQSETYGTVRADRIQSVFMSKTQMVSEIYVSEGDTVSAGDPLVAFDTTLTDIELKRAEIKVAQLKLKLEQAENELEYINGLPIGSAYTPERHYRKYDKDIPFVRAGSGTAKDPFVLVWDPTCTFTTGTLNMVLATEPESPEPDIGTDPAGGGDEPGGEGGEASASSLPPDAQPAPEDMADYRAMDAQGTEDPPSDGGEEPGGGEVPGGGDEPEPPDEGPYYIIFEIREQNSPDGFVIGNYMMIAYTSDRVVSSIPPFRITDTPEYNRLNPKDNGSSVVYYSYSEVAEMRKNALKAIEDLTMELRKAELEYSTLEHEITNGIVLADTDGVVKTIADPDAVMGSTDPLIVVSGGGGYLVSGALSEDELALMKVGDTVNAMSWETYTSYDAVIVDIQEYPVSSGSYSHYGQGNSNSTLYLFTASLGDAVNCRVGEYMDITYTPGSSAETGIFIPNMFIRSENGRSYVLAEGPDGKLEKRYIVKGKSLYGSYTEILDGITRDDYLAFPYGKGVKPGASAKRASVDALYMY